MTFAEAVDLYTSYDEGFVTLVVGNRLVVSIDGEMMAYDKSYLLKRIKEIYRDETAWLEEEGVWDSVHKYEYPEEGETKQWLRKAAKLLKLPLQVWMQPGYVHQSLQSPPQRWYTRVSKGSDL